MEPLGSAEHLLGNTTIKYSRVLYLYIAKRNLAEITSLKMNSALNLKCREFNGNENLSEKHKKTNNTAH